MSEIDKISTHENRQGGYFASWNHAAHAHNLHFQR